MSKQNLSFATASRGLLIVAGGTGGHLFPAQQLAEILKEEFDILFAGHKIGTSPFFEREKIPFVEIAAHPLKKGFFSAAWKGFWQACKVIRQFAPDVVVGFGSYHTFPIILAAAVLRKKLVLFEANCSLGRVNRLFRSVATCVAFQFPFESVNTKKARFPWNRMKNGALVPLLPWKEEKTRLDQREAKMFYGLDPEKNTILVFGGSQGAAFLNEMAPKVIAKLRETFQAIHLAGAREEETVRLAYEKLGISACVKSFEKEMAHAYVAADLALCRSGAGTVAELIRYTLPAVLIPYPFATENHQRKNGEYLTDILGGGRLVDQADADVDLLAAELNALHVEKEEKKLRLCRAFEENRQRIHLAEIIRRIGPL